MSQDRIRVLVVDDSAFARKVIREVLAQDPEIEVIGIARDGLEALEKIAELEPDVMTLDLVMPDLDGLGVLKALPKDSRTKVVVVSVSGSETDLALEALEYGAVDLVTKPTPLPTERLYEIKSDLVAKVKAAAAACPRPRTQVRAPLVLDRNRLSSGDSKTRLVVIGTSTGGPQALTQLFSALPAGLPFPIAIALHIPSGFTEPLAARLSQVGAVKVTEAYEGLQLVAGQAVIAPGGMHLRIVARGDGLFCKISFEPVDTLHHPSVDVLFQSAAECVGERALGVVLTGMGNDGTAGSGKIRDKGGRVIIESASSCVIYGMPRSVLEAGFANAEAPLERIAALIVSQVVDQVLTRL
jgi:two-component system chemotaxis response regulator CheB